MTVKFITVKGPDRLARAPFYLGIPQHERTMSRREAYEHVALKTGYTPTAVRAVFMAAAEYVALANARGAETKAEITFSDLQNVKARLAAALEPGEYTLKVYTRSGLGDQYGVHVATRKVQVG
jgi:acyl-CoA synthetase (NDP forming)